VEIVLLVVRLLMAAALYAFLGWGLWLIWKSLQDKPSGWMHPACRL